MSCWVSDQTTVTRGIVQITFWGVRGSLPAPGAATVRYGGNTPCIEVRSGDSQVIVDAGTGIYALGRQLETQPGRLSLVFSHVHWDHIQGLTSFAPLHDPERQLTIYASERSLAFLQKILTPRVYPSYSPISPRTVQASIDWVTIRAREPWNIGEIELEAVDLNHPATNLGFRFQAGGYSAVHYSDSAPYTEILFGDSYIAHAPQAGTPLGRDDHAVLQAMRQEAIQLAAQADLLIHDAQYTAQEFRHYAHFGHSTPEHAIEMARATGARKLYLFHHAPTRSDDQVAEIEDLYRPLAAKDGISLQAAREGEEVQL